MTSRLKGVICYDPGVESNNHKRHHKTGIYSVCAVCSACNAGLSRTSFVVKQLKMNNGNDVVKMTEALPLALLALRAKIATAKNLHPERLGALYPKYCAVMKQIREEKGLSIEELSALSGLSENFLEAAESGTVELTDDNLEALQGVFWELSIGEDNPGDFKRLANKRLAKPYPEVGSKMREIREEKQISIKELSNLSGVPEDILEAAESGTLAMIGDDLEDVQRIYWSLSAVEASSADYRGLLVAMATQASGD